MSYRIDRLDETTEFRVHFTGESPNLVALPMAPARRELQLDGSEWLVLAFATWSGPDRDQIVVASTIAREFSRLTVGVRPFDEFSEFEQWLPVTTNSRSPVWARLSNGKVLWELTRCVTVAEITILLEPDGVR